MENAKANVAIALLLMLYSWPGPAMQSLESN